MIILGIDTSCDDTAVAVLEIKKANFKVLANFVSSQVKLHAAYGGVYPMLAKREHKKNLPIVLKKALKEAKVKQPDYIALTIGPGLEPCLWEGINFAIELSKKWNVPIIPVNHIEGHLLANLTQNKLPKTPLIALIVSGGHTQLILVKGVGKYEIIGETRDDAAGECFDKAARILGLPYPGGPEIAKQAQLPTTNYKLPTIKLPRPMLHSKDYDFSFSGLKTAVLYDYKKRTPKIKKSPTYIQSISKEIQQAIIDCLIKKTIKAASHFKAKAVILGGGVTANKELKKQMQIACTKQSIAFTVPAPNLATDNGLMVAIAGHFNRSKKTKNYAKLKANGNLRL